MPRRKPQGPLSESKRKELESRAAMGPRIGHATTRRQPSRPTAEPGLPRIKSRGIGKDHPTRDVRE